jgi:Protein of unknown function (DUF3613)
MNTMPSLNHLHAPVRLGKRWPRAVLASAMLMVVANICFAQVRTGPAAPAEAVNAASGPEASKEISIGKGDATRAWLGAQAGRKQGSQTRQSLSGPVMSTVHDRYVKSFAQPIEPTPIRADMVNTNR